MNLSTISETLDYIADNDLRYVIEITENVPHFPGDAAVKNAVFGLMGESLKAMQMDLRKLALRVRAFEEAVE
jgi:hypothetical protein